MKYSKWMDHRDAAAESFTDVNSSGSKPEGGSLVIPDTPSVMLLQFHHCQTSLLNLN